MPLPKDYSLASVNDVRGRFNASIIDLDGRPVQVYGVQECSLDKHGCRTILHLFDLVSGRKRTVPINDPGFNIKDLGRNLGYFNLGIKENICAYISRVPNLGQAKTQGLSSRNCLTGFYMDGFKMVDAPIPFHMYSAPNISIMTALDIDQENQNKILRTADDIAMSYTLYPLVIDKGFIDMWNGKYPKAMEVLDSDKKFTVAVSPKHILQKDDFKDVYLVTQHERVGKFTKDKVRYLDRKRYLSEEVERRTGICPV